MNDINDINDIIPPEHGVVVITPYRVAVATVNTLLSWTDTWEKTLEFREKMRKCSQNLREVHGERNNGNRD